MNPTITPPITGMKTIHQCIASRDVGGVLLAIEKLPCQAMFVISQIRCIRICAMHAAAIARAIETTEISTTRPSTSDACPGTAVCSSAGPRDGETGRPSVVAADSTVGLSMCGYGSRNDFYGERSSHARGRSDEARHVAMQSRSLASVVNPTGASAT